jgi:Asp-tRNA(Asn)/Glu-tRNA(Gln) amidotransferase B subunit
VVKFLVGQMMKISRGKADPKVSESLIKDKLKHLQQ